MTELMHPENESRRRTSKVAGQAAPFIGTALPPLAFVLLSALAGCTALLDTEKGQCRIDDDCTDLFGAEAPYLCVQNVCERPTCEQDSDCRSRGGRFATSLCSPEQHQCVPAECTAIDGCGSGRVCELSSNRCVARECTVTQECLTAERESPTVQCVQGLCRDDAWGCIGQPDDRQPAPGEKGTLRIPLFNPTTKGPLVGSNWKATVCALADQLPDCEPPIDVPSSYDPATGVVTIEQLDSTLPVRVLLDETQLFDATRLNGKTAINMEFITQKPPVGVVTTQPLRIVTWEWIASLIESYRQGAAITGKNDALGTTFVLGTQTIFGDAFDCQDKPAANVNVTFKLQAEGSSELQDFGPWHPNWARYQPYFWDEQNLAITPPTKLATYGTGVWSTANLPVQTTLFMQSNLLVDDRNNRSRVIRADYPVFLNASRMMTIHLYPRNYAVTSTQQ